MSFMNLGNHHTHPLLWHPSQLLLAWVSCCCQLVLLLFRPSVFFIAVDSNFFTSDSNCDSWPPGFWAFNQVSPWSTPTSLTLRWSLTSEFSSEDHIGACPDGSASKHWGQRGSYLAGTLWVCWEFLSNLLILCPAGKLRVLSKLTHHFDLNVIGGYGEIKFKMSPSNHPADILWMNPPGFFTILIKMYPQCAWATHWGFFQRIPSYLITMYLTIYSMSSLRVCGKIEPHWEFVVSFLKRTHWTH